MDSNHPHSDPFQTTEREVQQSSPLKTTRSWLEWKPRRWVLLVLVCVALVIRGRAMLSMQNSLDADPDHYRQIARTLQVDHTFGFWYLGNAYPTAFRPPLYPLLLAPLGYLPSGHRVQGLLHVALGVAAACIVWRLGLAWGLPPIASLLAAALVVVDPILINQQAVVMTETLSAFLAAAALLTLIRASETNSLVRAAICGIVLGMCVLCRPTFAAWLVAVAAAWPFVISRPRIARLVMLIAFASIAIAPWAVRNQLQFGRPIVTTTHGGYTLLLGNNPCFYRWLREGAWGSVWNGEELDAYLEGRSGKSISSRGLALWEWAYSTGVADSSVSSRPQLTLSSAYHVPNDETDCDRAAYQLAFESIRNEPGMFAYACLVRVGRLWGVLPHQTSAYESPSRRGLRFAVAVFYLCELALAVVGLWSLRSRLWRTPVIWGLLLALSFTAVHTVYWTDLRMRAPLVCVVALLAASGLSRLAAGKPYATPFAETA
jgi:4-amino-4-deoxy-L-arabinose transferase-like glycosyltransferase